MREALRNPSNEILEAMSAAFSAEPSKYDPMPHYLQRQRNALLAAISRLPEKSETNINDWRSIDTAPKDGTRILVILKNPIPNKDRDDIEQWQGIPFVARHPGVCKDGFDIGWGFAAPVGHGGFPDEWIAGWQPLPPPPL